MNPSSKTLRIATLSVVVAAVAWACTVNRNPHDDEGTTFPLAGRHAAIACEACHGSGAFGPLDPACEACHEDDRPPGHFPGSCGDVGCHIPVGWDASGGVIGDDDDDTVIGDDDDTTPTGDDDDTTTPTGDDDDTTTPTGDDDDTTTPTGNFHETFPLEGPHDRACTDCHANLASPTERIVCLDCHEADRDTPSHYTGQDCAHCHPVEVGWGSAINHPFKLAHPKPGLLVPVNDGCVSIPNPEGVQTCISCHPDPTDRAGDWGCIGCHLEVETECRHGGLPTYVWADTNCLTCHPSGS